MVLKLKKHGDVNKAEGLATREKSDNGITLSPGIYYYLSDHFFHFFQHPTYSVFWYFTLDDPNHVKFFAHFIQSVKVKSYP